MGVFSTSLSKEYAIAAKAFNLSKAQLFGLSKNAIEYTFASEETKDKLRKKWESHTDSKLLME